jgi:hypothetical protein
MTELVSLCLTFWKYVSINFLPRATTDSSVVQNLTLAIRQSLERLRVLRKGAEIQFDMLT